MFAHIQEIELNSTMIDRGHSFIIPAGVQFHIYREGLLIFFAKVSIYLKAMGKQLPFQWQQRIG